MIYKQWNEWVILLLFYWSHWKCWAHCIALWDCDKRCRSETVHCIHNACYQNVGMLFKRNTENWFVKLYFKSFLLPLLIYVQLFLISLFQSVVLQSPLCEKQKQTAETSDLLLTEEWLLNKNTIWVVLKCMLWYQKICLW